MDDRWTPLLAALRERFASDMDIVEVEAYLSSQGYDRRQIGEILSLLHRHLTEGAPRPAAAANEPVRLQGPHERGRFAPEAWGFLLRLAGGGHITRNDFEQLVERALAHVDGRIGLADIRAIADEAGVGDPASGDDLLQVH